MAVIPAKISEITAIRAHETASTIKRATELSDSLTVQRAMPEIRLNDRTARERWRLWRVATGLPLLLLAVANTVHLGADDHEWVLAISINIMLAASVPFLLRYLRKLDARTLANAPAGTLFAGGGNITLASLDRQPTFEAATATMNRRWAAGYVAGSVLVDRQMLRFVPGPKLGHGASEIRVPWGAVATVELAKLPAKFNIGGLDLSMRDGSTLSIEVRGYDRLREALAHLRTQRRRRPLVADAKTG